jgi:hypothetical protein
MKKLFTILFCLAFLLQALPVKQWVGNYVKDNTPVEITDNTDSNEKNNTEKEKDVKEEIIFQNVSLTWQKLCKTKKLNMLSSQNAIILHHSEVSAPPPDFIG